MTDFVVFAGESRRLRIYVTTASGQPFPLGDCEIVYRHGREIEKHDIEKRIGDGIEIVDAEAGIIGVALDPQDTAGVSGHRYYEVRIREADGTVSTVCA